MTTPGNNKEEVSTVQRSGINRIDIDRITTLCWYDIAFFWQVDRGVPFSMGLGLKEQADEVATKEISGLETKETDTRQAMQEVLCDTPSDPLLLPPPRPPRRTFCLLGTVPSGHIRSVSLCLFFLLLAHCRKLLEPCLVTTPSVFRMSMVLTT